MFFTLGHLATLQNAAILFGTDFNNQFSSGLDEDVLGDRFRSFASNCLALSGCPCDRNQPMCTLPGSLMFQSNLLGMTKPAQESCGIPGDIGQICSWKPSASVLVWTAFQSLGILPGILQFSSRDMASAIIRVTYILISQIPVFKKLSLSANLELCASYMCCQ